MSRTWKMVIHMNYAGIMVNNTRVEWGWNILIIFGINQRKFGI